VEYVVTIFEENIKGKTQVFTVTSGFNSPIEFRPIIKTSTTTAIIDIQMNLIDQVDSSQIVRRASYGMLSDEVSKYSLNLSKINVDNINKLKIYNLKNTIASSDSLFNSAKNGLSGNTSDTSSLFGSGAGSGIRIEQVKVPFPEFIEKKNIVAKSQTIKVNKDVYWGNGKLQIVIYPYDNVLQFTIAQDVSSTKSPNNPDTVTPFNLNKNNEILLTFKSKTTTVETKLYLNNDNVDLVNGQVVFKVYQSQIPNIRKVYDSGINLFYIISKTSTSKDVIYSGTFEMWDATDNVIDLNGFADQSFEFDGGDTNALLDNTTSQETALVVRQRGGTNGGSGGVGKSTNNNTTNGGSNNDQVAALNQIIKNSEVKQNNATTTIETSYSSGIDIVKSLRNTKLSLEQRDEVLKKISVSYASIDIGKSLDSSNFVAAKNELDIEVDKFINAQNSKYNAGFSEKIKSWKN
jgi:hypothetical protein